MPDKLTLIQDVQKAVTVFVIAIAGSFCRLLFYKDQSFVATLLTFVGGIVFGTIAGYITSLTSMSGWSNIFAAIAAIAGKEIVKLIIVDAPAFIKNIANKKAGFKNGTDNNDNLNAN